MRVDQTTFHAAILDPAQPRPTGLEDGQGAAAGRRFDVYRNNVAVSLTEALEAAFPVLRKLVGDNNFKVLAGAFLRQHPPQSPLMMYYGAAMPTFLADFEPTKPIAYLPDVARLELALRESYHAADAAPFDATRLNAMPPERLMATRVTLAPTVRLIRSPWPILAIWRFNTVDGAPKPDMQADDVLIVRPEFDPIPIALPPGGGTFVAALQAGHTLGDAYAAALTEYPETDLGAILALLLANAALADLGDPS